MATIPMRSSPRPSGRRSAARARNRDERSGMSRSASVTTSGVPRANASDTIAASSGAASRARWERRRGRSPRSPATRRCGGCVRRAAAGCRLSRRARAGAATAAGRRAASCAPAAKPAREGPGPLPALLSAAEDGPVSRLVRASWDICLVFCKWGSRGSIPGIVCHWYTVRHYATPTVKSAVNSCEIGCYRGSAL